jgi:hypothetical protein
MHPTTMVHAAVRHALMSGVPDPGEAAGDFIMQLAADRGIEYDRDRTNLYRCALSHASASDLIVTAIQRSRKETWSVPSDLPQWRTSAMIDPSGDKLRRFVAVSAWSEGRDLYEKRSWHVLGEICHYELPMEMVVAVLGPLQSGRRQSHWNKALFHHNGNQLRFRLRRRASVEGFKETWQVIYREEHAEITREKWLDAMRDDEVLQDSLFVVRIPVPDEAQCGIIRDLAARQLDRLHAIAEVPPRQLVTCNEPLHPCPFRICCWSDPEMAPENSDVFNRR